MTESATHLRHIHDIASAKSSATNYPVGLVEMFRHSCANGTEGIGVTPDKVLEYWVDELGPEGWYKQDEALDAEIRERFETTWQEACQNVHHGWQCRSRDMLSLIILLDQFPRNMFRNSAKTFASDRLALKYAKKAVDAGQDRRVDGPARQFFYIPLMHSECLMDQEKCVRLFMMNMPDSGNIDHAKAHREIIRRFGRFPYRNEVLGRASTDAEKAFLESSGYSDILRGIQADAAKSLAG